MKRKNPILTVLLIALCAVAGVCIYRLVSKTAPYRESRKLYASLSEEYSPQSTSESESQPSENQPSHDPSETTNAGNPSVARLCRDYAAAVGWLTIPNTNINYPFVYSEDNNDFLHSDLEGNYLYAGTIFIDYHCARDFSSRNTVIYGHNMRYDGTMFAELAKFKEEEFFRNNTVAYIYLPKETLVLDIFAIVIVDGVKEEHIYSNELSADDLSYISEKALYERPVTAEEGSRFVTLSTCTYEFSDARMALLCKVREPAEQGSDENNPTP